MPYFFVLLFFLFLTPSAYAVNELSSGEECEKKIISLIDDAREHIDVAVYSLNRKSLFQALLKARQRGVRVRILLDRQMLSATKEMADVFLLLDSGAEIRVHKHQGKMHVKMSVFDDHSAFSGSFNWTDPAVRQNDEICNFFINDSEYTTQHQKFFDELWNKNPASFSKKWFKKQGKCGKHWLLRT